MWTEVPVPMPMPMPMWRRKVLWKERNEEEVLWIRTTTTMPMWSRMWMPTWLSLQVRWRMHLQTRGNEWMSMLQMPKKQGWMLLLQQEMWQEMLQEGAESY